MPAIMIDGMCFSGPGAEEEARQWRIKDALKDNPSDRWALRELFADAGVALENSERGGELSQIAENIRERMVATFPFLKPAV